MGQLCSSAYVPEFSFIYGGAASTDLLPQWIYRVSGAPALSGGLEYHSWIDPRTSLKVTIQLRRLAAFAAADRYACDWIITFENQGSIDSLILEAVLPLDTLVEMPAGERLRLHYANGSSWAKDDFLPQVAELPPGTQKNLAPLGGYSSHGVLPFMNLQRRDGGLVLAIGWSGQWSARFERDANGFRLAAGMERTYLRLNTGEQIRTPRILVLPWEGEDIEIGQNLFRRMLLDCYLPRLEGQLILPPVAQSLMSYYYLTGQAGEAFELAALPKSADLCANVHWIDACWYGGQRQWWQEVGTWEANQSRFPHGLKPISDAAHQAGMKFLLWFEPERARSDSRLAREHPEFFLRIPQDPDNLLLDLGNPAAREYVTDLISGCIAEYGVDIYRQDFNFDAVLPYWQAADTPERAGMTEIRYVEGLYAFWEALCRRHPGLWIDNCASGGRRIDLETLSRSLPLWPSDFLESLSYGLKLMVGEQCINAGLARWVPLFGGGVFNFTPYSTRSQIIGGFNFSYHVDYADFPSGEEPGIVAGNDVLARGRCLLDDDFPMEQARLAIAEWQSLRPFVLGDFHLLLPLTASDHDWCAWQFHRPDLQAGAAVILRRHRSPFPSIEISLKWIVPHMKYSISLSPGYNAEPEREMPGKALLNLALTILEKPGSLLLRYRQVA
jgi:alpha-galactosidase